MKRLLTLALTTMAGTLALIGAVHAADADDILATGGIYGGPSQAAAVCYVYNPGSRPVFISSAVIRNQSGAIVANLTTNSCHMMALPPSQTCALDAVATNQSYSCTISAERAGTLRGNMDMRTSTGAVLANSNLVATSGSKEHDDK
jgi:hypothetical protein